MFSKTWTQPSTAVSSDPIEQLKGALASADAVVVGAGAGLSASALVAALFMFVCDGSFLA